MIALICVDYFTAFDKVKTSYCYVKILWNWRSPNILLSIGLIVVDKRHLGTKQILAGVPQGPALGPLVLLLYTHDLLNYLTYSLLESFADDSQILLYFNLNNVNEAITGINIDIWGKQYVNHWFCHFYLTVILYFIRISIR